MKIFLDSHVPPDHRSIGRRVQLASYESSLRLAGPAGAPYQCCPAAYRVLRARAPRRHCRDSRVLDRAAGASALCIAALIAQGARSQPPGLRARSTRRHDPPPRLGGAGRRRGRRRADGARQAAHGPAARRRCAPQHCGLAAPPSLTRAPRLRAARHLRQGRAVRRAGQPRRRLRDLLPQDHPALPEHLQKKVRARALRRAALPCSDLYPPPPAAKRSTSR